MSAPEIGLVGVGALLALIALGCPLALAMAAVGVGGFAAIVAVEPALALLQSAPVDTLSNYAFSPIPLFLFMGVLASRSRLSADLFAGARVLFGGWRGGMAMAALCSCTVFSAISGSSLATAASMARVALPEMRANGYAASLATGTLAAGGTLGIMIPPSIALLLYALITEQSVSALFMAGIVPGLLGLVLYGGAVTVMVALKPSLAQPGTPRTLGEKLAGLKGVAPFFGIFAAILGGLYGGLFTPTEAAGVGAGCTLVVALARGLSWADFLSSVEETVLLSAMIFFVIVGADLFGTFLSVSRLADTLATWVAAQSLAPLSILLVVLALFLALGCVMDGLAMMLLTVPVVYPVIVGAGFDPVWFGVMTVVTVELGLITPPVGMNVFVLRSVVPDVAIHRIFKGVMPFVVADVVRLAILIACPWLVLSA
ncbi:TRAP transporter large permease [Pararhodospirillum oryzae]|uniref:TRAP transporter large permease protein n=1 Tax=Pararhodospirillum oryzae TaxID=478448 RepID=A0A512HB31_9PROT|nr:TRAP transporter large permease [Pararhodospirillum oryzae]GEO82649.1 C4-dicarboxylate ABC transporter permease [Pararhodospirillum oryzae]